MSFLFVSTLEKSLCYLTLDVYRCDCYINGNDGILKILESISLLINQKMVGYLQYQFFACVNLCKIALDDALQDPSDYNRY